MGRAGEGATRGMRGRAVAGAAVLALLLACGDVPAAPARAQGPDVIVTGVVRDTSGQPLADAVIVAVGDGSTLNEQSVRTKADGSYRTIVGLSTSLSVEVDLASYTTRRQTLTFTSPPAGPLTVDFSGPVQGLAPLPALFLASGTGLFADQGSTLQVTGRSYAPGATVTVGLGAGGGQQVTADGSGAFTLALSVPATLAPGPYLLTSRPTASSTSPVVIVRAAVPPTATAPPAPSATATAIMPPAPTASAPPVPSATATPTATSPSAPTATPTMAPLPRPVARRLPASTFTFTRRWYSAALRRVLARYHRHAPSTHPRRPAARG